ncbi:Chitin synthase activator (Chs3) [Rasamsonia emersonii CBS 393.64]|uniref:Chitin synthase activator (Chs3) n=1 Tax=Rasamsonia emersonii (strain ATCC 16479 / CBS 393.64 / IMI 116815) TaxID=1408163 RepID=A0A0F4YFR1_RASE3|nr:Chitin synthase activator (Chs3) [Rasamsonia emersonii CBS 393.64]KKA16999.1 Chitin synthase activator (Chs3) [Rasamsonia emersonii CBS 393.64]
MASPDTDAFRPPISPPPPVYLRSSPPPPAPSDPPPPPPGAEPGSPGSSKPAIRRKPVPNAPIQVDGNAHMQKSPLSPVKIDNPAEIPQASSVMVEGPGDADSRSPSLVEALSNMGISQAIGHGSDDAAVQFPHRTDSLPPQSRANRHASASTESWSLVGSNDRDDGQKGESIAGQDTSSKNQRPSNASDVSLDSMSPPMEYQPLQYHHLREEPTSRKASGPMGTYSGSSSAEHLASSSQHLAPGRASYGGMPRPNSAYSSVSDLGGRGRSPHPSPGRHTRAPSSHSAASPDVRPTSSFVDLLTASYPQPSPSPAGLNNAHLRMSLGNNVSLLSHKQTFEMYLANVKKTNDPAVQYEFAVFMVNAIQEMKDFGRWLDKGKEDYDRALPLFVAAAKHGHAEAAYRAGLCNEFGWGCRVDGSKAVQFYRQAASKKHPGAMLRLGRACLSGDMGLGKRYREGVKWLKRAAESADYQYNSGPYELGLLHETGFGDDVFPDPSYAAQLFTKSAELGHVEASYRLGDAYEHGKLNCPRDPALSIHFYTGAAQKGHPQAMMALCAWYLVGAEPVLEKDENEAYEWARQAAELGLAKAQYAVGILRRWESAAVAIL